MAAKNSPIVSDNPQKNQGQPPVTKDLTVTKDEAINLGTFPRSEQEKSRLMNYDYYQKLFMGEHFEAFNIRIDNSDWSATYKKLRYIKANFAGLISKVIADILFSEPIIIKAEKNKEFLEALMYENNMNAQLYESALTNSALGDDVFKIRVGPRHPEDPRDPSTILIEEVNPALFFPNYYPFNNKSAPQSMEIAWKFKLDDKNYLRKEIHTHGRIENKVYLMDGDKIDREVGLDVLGIPGILPEQQIDIDRYTLIHIPNWKVAHKPMGISDYYDLDSLFYAINNRMTMIDNILDKHSDPILMVPPGILDKDGKVKKKALGVMEYEEGTSGEPKYIVWDASLENAFKEVEKLVELLFMESETSPDILGLGSGQADSGRALRLKLLRTIAKAKRKRIYYDRAIKEMLYVSQLLAKQYKIKVNGIGLDGEPEIPEIEWQDGLPADPYEAAQIEEIRQNAGIASKVSSIMRLDDLDEESAQKVVEEIDKETKIDMPTMNMGNLPGKPPIDETGKPVKQQPADAQKK